jgi:hypothetical protein
MVARNRHIGSSLDDFLNEEGLLAETEATALKRVVAFQLQKAMKERHVTKTQMAVRMHTSRSAIERLFDPENDSMTLVTLNKAATALGKKLKIQLV